MSHWQLAGGFCVAKNMNETKGFYKTAAWLKCRDGYIKHVGGLCERCLARGLIVPGYIVHHKCYLNAENITDPSITLNWDNLEYLCKYHHNNEHFGEQKKRRFSIDANGKVIVNENMDCL